MDKPTRKPVRLKDFNYSTNGAYFITICVKDRSHILGEIVGGDALIAPQNCLSKLGIICKKYIEDINHIYVGASVDNYVIMPNHIHMLISINGTMRTSSPTNNISAIIRSFKTMVTRKVGASIWQRSFHDHIIRDQNDYAVRWNYIDTNIVKWEEDIYYTKKSQ